MTEIIVFEAANERDCFYVCKGDNRLKVYKTTGGAHLIKIDNPNSKFFRKTLSRLDWATNEEAIEAAKKLIVK